MSTQQFMDAVRLRRSVYQLGKDIPVTDARIQELIKETILHVPSSFNTQTARVVLLVKEEHEKLWDMTKDILKAIVPADGWAATEGKLNMFKAAYGTALFFESRSTVAKAQATYSAYADKFPTWATQSDGMHQYVLWTALAAEGLGCNLQHYNPLIDQKVTETWGVDTDWELRSQLVFGKPEGQPGEKQHAPVEERFKSFGV